MDLFAREFFLPRQWLRELHLDGKLSVQEIAAACGAPHAVVAQQLLDAIFLPIVRIPLSERAPSKPFNDEQATAIKHRGAPYLLEAGPGTGKTQTLVGRITDLIETGLNPTKILVLTFSNKAAGELSERIALSYPQAAAAMWIGTFHAFGFDLIKRFHDRLDEPFDLRERGVERFIAFRTDREFKLTLNDSQLEWGKPVVSGAVLYKLGNVPADQAVFLEVRGGEDRLIEPQELIDLTQPGIERFITAPRPVPTFEFIVNARPKVVHDPHVTFGQIVELAFAGPHGPQIFFSMTFRHAASKPHAGELGIGGTVEVKKKGTVFNVTRIDKS
jgi:hypothetical protein